MSMADSDSAESFMGGPCNGNRERATSGHEQQERQGERGPSGGEREGLAGDTAGY